MAFAALEVQPRLANDELLHELHRHHQQRGKPTPVQFQQPRQKRHNNEPDLAIIEVVEKETLPVKDHEHRSIQRNILEGAKKSARRVEKKYGKENLGPWDDFEGGMINGKLSALRWILGEDWDELYT
jgi:hypothetical protein